MNTTRSYRKILMSAIAAEFKASKNQLLKTLYIGLATPAEIRSNKLHKFAQR